MMDRGAGDGGTGQGGSMSSKATRELRPPGERPQGAAMVSLRGERGPGRLTTRRCHAPGRTAALRRRAAGLTPRKRFSTPWVTTSAKGLSDQATVGRAPGELERADIH